MSPPATPSAHAMAIKLNKTQTSSLYTLYRDRTEGKMVARKHSTVSPCGFAHFFSELGGICAHRNNSCTPVNIIRWIPVDQNSISPGNMLQATADGTVVLRCGIRINCTLTPYPTYYESPVTCCRSVCYSCVDRVNQTCTDVAKKGIRCLEGEISCGCCVHARLLSSMSCLFSCCCFPVYSSCIVEQSFLWFQCQNFSVGA